MRYIFAPESVSGQLHDSYPGEMHTLHVLSGLLENMHIVEPWTKYHVIPLGKTILFPSYWKVCILQAALCKWNVLTTDDMMQVYIVFTTFVLFHICRDYACSA